MSQSQNTSVCRLLTAIKVLKKLEPNGAKVVAFDFSTKLIVHAK